MIDQAQKLREIAAAAAAGSPLSMTQKTASKRCVSIAVTSGKGGVGKTTLSLVLAASLAKLQKKVLLMDVDLGLANLHILLGIAPRFNIGHVVSGACGINDVVIEVTPGVYLVPGASGLEHLANLDADQLERLRLDFLKFEDGYDFLIMDTGAGISSVVTGFVRHADLVLLVMTPDPSSFADAYAMVKVLYGKGCTNIAVAVNMAADEREGHARFNELNELVVKFLKNPTELYAILPNDSEILRLGRRQIHLVGQRNGNRFYGITSLLAKKICGIDKVGTDSGFFDRLFRGAR